ncbi:MAG: hypothetical protein Q9163_000224 [Psora crenata]
MGTTVPLTDHAYAYRSLAIPQAEDDPWIRKTYRPFLLSDTVTKHDWDWRKDKGPGFDRKPEEKVIHLICLRSTFEGARILFRLGCDVRVFDASGLPMKDDMQHDHPKVEELRALSRWSDAHFWVSPEQHGNLTAVFKNQIDWIPLTLGSARPTQGRTLAIAQVSGGSQSFNAVNSLRILGRWMRMFTIPNQSSVPMAYTQFSDEDAEEGGNRMKLSGNRDRIVDCMEELVKYTIIMRPHFDLFGDRYSERTERAIKAAKDVTDRNTDDNVNGVVLNRI